MRFAVHAVFLLALMCPALAQLTNPPPTLAATGPNPVLAPHAGDLVTFQGGKFVPFDSAAWLQAPYTILYFGAGWCPDCRRFSPALVAAYDKQPAGQKRFEVLLLSRDKSAADMLKFMQTEKMSWPALAYEKIEGARDLQKFFSGQGIPCLTVIDREGTILLQSKSDQDGKEILSQFEQRLERQ